ncbi:DUF167 domain-containing protein [Bacteroidota bacterium]
MTVDDYIENSCLKIHVKPNSNKTQIKGYDDNKGLLVDVAASADKNKANVEVVKFFSKLLKKKVEIKKGMRNKDKLLLIH